MSIHAIKRFSDRGMLAQVGVPCPVCAGRGELPSLKPVYLPECDTLTWDPGPCPCCRSRGFVEVFCNDCGSMLRSYPGGSAFCPICNPPSEQKTEPAVSPPTPFPWSDKKDR